jgi:hypothetical protein
MGRGNVRLSSKFTLFETSILPAFSHREKDTPSTSGRGMARLTLSVGSLRVRE